jgi:hypothetical protein
MARGCTEFFTRSLREKLDSEPTQSVKSVAYSAFGVCLAAGRSRRSRLLNHETTPMLIYLDKYWRSLIP